MKPILERSGDDALRLEVTSELRGFEPPLDQLHDQRNDIVPLADDSLWLVRTASEEAGGSR